MKLGQTGAKATGQLMLILGGAMVLLIGKGDLLVITSGMLIGLGGIYILSLVNPATKRFMGAGWPEKFCRISAVLTGLLVASSGLICTMGGIEDMLVFHSLEGLNILLVCLLPLFWGFYILTLAIYGVHS
jgi:hypothetical protein